MAYIGNPPTVGQWRKLDDISGSFNGVITTFTTSVGGSNVTAGSANQLLVSLGGVLQQPNVDYSVTTNSIIFTTAPASGLDFFAVLAGDALNAGTPGDGTVTTAKLAGNLTVDLDSGSAAAPSLTFDSNTGIYSPGADELALSTNGTGRLFVDSSGRLLVGTSSARSNFYNSSVTAKSQIEYSDATFTAGLSCVYNLAGSSGSEIVLGKTRSSSIGGNTLVAADDTTGVISFQGADGSELVECATIRAQVDGTPGANDMPGRLMFSTTADGASSPTERMRIDSSGRVGIGTTPVTTLDVNGSCQITGSASGYSGGEVRLGSTTADLQHSVSTQSTGTPFMFFDHRGTGNTGIFAWRVGTGGASERMRIDSSGRLLVGTSSARTYTTGGATGNHKLQIETAGATSVFTTAGIYSNSDVAGLGAYLELGRSKGTSLGAVTAVAQDDILGEIRFAGTNGTGVNSAASIAGYVDGAVSGGGANDMPGRLVFSTTADGASSPTERMRIHNSGTITTQSGLNVGDSSMTSGGTTFILNGAIIGSGAGTNALKWNNGTGVVTYDTSSRLIKNQIVDCPYGIDALKQLQPRKYFRTDDEREEIGFIADEVIQVVPEFVPVGPKSVITRNEADTEEIPLGVNYDRLTAVLTKALQEAVARIEQLEAEMAEVKAQLS